MKQLLLFIALLCSVSVIVQILIFWRSDKICCGITHYDSNGIGYTHWMDKKEYDDSVKAIHSGYHAIGEDSVGCFVADGSYSRSIISHMDSAEFLRNVSIPHFYYYKGDDYFPSLNAFQNFIFNNPLNK